MVNSNDKLLSSHNNPINDATLSNAIHLPYYKFLFRSFLLQQYTLYNSIPLNKLGIDFKNLYSLRLQSVTG